MSQRGADFLKEWIQQNINAVAYSSLYDTRAKVMAEQCAADGYQIGICVGEIEVETGDLTDCMLRAMAAREQAARGSTLACPQTATPAASRRNW